MTREQFIQIAKAGFPERIKSNFNFEKARIYLSDGVYFLFDEYDKQALVLTIGVDEDNENLKLIHIDAGFRAFNHYSAIKEIEKLGFV